MVDSSNDFYALLEVSPSATQEEIKKAYFAAAKKYHPDVYHGPDSQQRFQKINEAYETLKDPLKRASYDSFRNSYTRSGNRTNRNSGNTSYEDQNDYIQDPVDECHNFYTELDLELFADREKIRKAYRDLSEKYDPATSLVPNAREKSRKISIAYSILNNPEKKERYDYLLRLLIKSGPKNKTTGNQSQSSSSGNRSGSAASSSSTKSSGTGSYQSSSSSNYSGSSAPRHRWVDDDPPRNENTTPEESPWPGCSKAFMIIFLLMMAYALLSTCSTNDHSATNRRTSGTSSYVQPLKTAVKTAKPTAKPKLTPTASNKATFKKHDITVRVGEEYHLGYYLPNDNQKYTYYFDSKELISVTLNQKSSELIIKGLEQGFSTIKLYDSNNYIVSQCLIRIVSNDNITSQKATPTKSVSPNSQSSRSVTKTPIPTAKVTRPISAKPTQHNPLLVATPSPTSWWGFEEQKMNVRIGESMELHFSIPQYSTFSYILDGSGTITVSYKDKSTLIVTGIRSGTGKVFLRNEKNEIVDTCTVTVSGNSAARQLTPTPLPRKQGGYTEKELIENGHIGTQNKDGTMHYPGFYQAPNGNYFPTGN